MKANCNWNVQPSLGLFTAEELSLGDLLEARG